MLDIHTHILPDVDDGSRNIKESIEMLKKENADGVKTVVLTPHFYATNEEPESFLKRRDEAFDLLAAEVSALSGSICLPDLIKGAEVRFYDGVGDMEGIEKFCIGNTDYILIEMPDRLWSKTIIEDLMKLRRRNIQPILAHINGYVAFRNTDLLHELIENGMLLQMNTEALYGFFTRHQAYELLNSKLIQFLGTDCHGMNHRAPDMGEAMKMLRKKCDEETERYLLRKAGLITGRRYNNEQIVEESN